MAWATSRYKTFVSGGSFTPADANAIQDQYVRATGILHDDLDKTSVAEILGLTQTAASSGGVAVRRGKNTTNAAETRSNAAFGLLATPDRVQNVVLPTDGLIYITFHASWHSSAASTAAAAIFLGSNQVKLVPTGGGAPAVHQVSIGTNGASEQALVTTTNGLATSNGASAYVPDNAIAQIQGGGVISGCGAGGICVIYAAAGTYDVSIQFLTTGGNTVTVANRRLRVWTQGFG